MEKLNKLISNLLNRCLDLYKLTWNQYYDLDGNLIIDGVIANEEICDCTIEIISDFLGNVKKLTNTFGDQVKVTIERTDTFKIEINEVLEFIK